MQRRSVYCVNTLSDAVGVSGRTDLLVRWGSHRGNFLRGNCSATNRAAFSKPPRRLSAGVICRESLTIRPEHPLVKPTWFWAKSEESKAASFPLNRSRRFGSDVIHHPIYAFHFINNPVGDRLQNFV